MQVSLRVYGPIYPAGLTRQGRPWTETRPHRNSKPSDEEVTTMQIEIKRLERLDTTTRKPCPVCGDC